jgi:protein-disulfide isomerase
MKPSTLLAAAFAGVLVGLAGGVAGTLAVLHVAGAREAPAAAAPAAAPVAAAPSAGAPAAPSAPGGDAIYKVPLEDSPVRGDKAALVTIVESSDFECPFCKRAVPTMKRVAETYGDKVRFVFKENPLSMHANALPAAKLAEEARAQGGDARFWEVADALFAAPSLDRASLEQLARAAGLEAKGVKEALDTPKHVDRIRRDQNLVNSLGASGTPTFFVNGRKVSGAQPFEAFQAVIDQELARAQGLRQAGVAPADLYARLVEKGATAPVAAPGGGEPPPMARVPLRVDDPVRGPKAAPVTLVLFSDFQCPFCGRVEPTLKQVVEAYGDQVRIVWKHQPLPMHPNALPAARAAEAARAQGRFWEMHDKLFADQQALSPEAFARYAKELKLDAARFERDAAADAGAKRIAEDQSLAASIGATGTPTLFVNCRRVVGAKPIEEFKRIVDEELAKARRLAARGDKVDGAFYDKICASNVAGTLAAR